MAYVPTALDWESPLRAAELNMGAELVPVGATAPFALPAADWFPSCIASVFGTDARFIMMHARQPGRGAAVRLAASLMAAKLTPVVVIPTGDVEARLQDLGWRKSLRDWHVPVPEWRPARWPDVVGRHVGEVA